MKSSGMRSSEAGFLGVSAVSTANSSEPRSPRWVPKIAQYLDATLFWGWNLEIDRNLFDQKIRESRSLRGSY